MSIHPGTQGRLLQYVREHGSHSLYGLQLTKGNLAAPAAAVSPVWPPAVRLCSTANGPSRASGVAPTRAPKAVSSPPLASVAFTCTAVAAKAK